MISVSYGMVLNTTLASILIGMIFALLYVLVYTIVSILFGRLSTKEKNDESSPKKSAIRNEAFDFLFFVIIGFLYVLINYALCDGVVVIYPPVFLAASFAITTAILRRILLSFGKFFVYR